MTDRLHGPTTKLDKVSREFNGLQAGRAFAALAVLLFHANAVLSLPKYLGRDLFSIFHAGSSGVHFFFVLSGFIIFYVHHREIGHPRFVGPFIRKRVSRLIPALWATLALVLASYLFWPSLNTNPSLTPLDIASAFFLLPVTREPLLVVEWTLRHEALFYALFVLAIASKRIGVTILTLWMAISLLLPTFQLNFPTNFFFSEYHVLFGVGILVAISFDKQWIRFPRATLLLGVSSFAIVWLLRVSGKEGILVNLAFGLAAGAIIAGVTEMERFKPIYAPKLLTFLGNASYSIYLVHFLAVSAASKVLLVMLRFTALPDILSFCFVAGSALLAGACFHFWIEQPLTSATRALLNQRKTKGSEAIASASSARESLP